MTRCCVRHLALGTVALLGLTCLSATAADPAGERLTSRPKPAAIEVKPAAIGEEVRTGETSGRRLLLRDGSVVLVQQGDGIEGGRAATLADDNRRSGRDGCSRPGR